MRSYRPARALLALVLVLLAPVAASAAPCSRVVAVGDLHGGYEAFVSILRETGILDDGGNWAGGEACLVQTGDVVDRGARSREILDLLVRLESEAPGRVHALLGNHEVMNLTDDLRYVSVEEYAAFAAEESAEEREAGFRAFAARRPAAEEAGALRGEFERAHPPGWFAHRRAFSRTGRYGKWLLTRPVLLSLEGSLFVHGGLDPADAPRGLPEIDARVRSDLRAYLEVREALEREGWLDPFVPFGEEFARVEGRLAAELAPGGRGGEALALAKRFLLLRANRFAAEDGPLWTRRLALEDETAFAPVVETMLGQLGVSRIVVGHTPSDDGKIRTRFGGRVFVIDTGAGPSYGGRVSALEIRDGTVRAIYPGESEVLSRGAVLSDAEIERFLAEAEVVQTEAIPTGITKPMKVRLEKGGLSRKAAFKTMDVYRAGVSHFDGRRPEFNFSDNYRYDRAAYLLDRLLGMHMVPVVVIRSIDGTKGALVDWVDDAVDEQKRLAENLLPPHPDTLDRQRDLMNLFDALIHNTDRNLGNQLLTPRDWRVHLIDHTRAFRTGDALASTFVEKPARLPRALYDRLVALEEKPLEEAMHGLLTRAHVRALLKRRDRIVAKIDKDRERLGDAAVFY